MLDMTEMQIKLTGKKYCWFSIPIFTVSETFNGYTWLSTGLS